MTEVSGGPLCPFSIVRAPLFSEASADLHRLSGMVDVGNGSVWNCKCIHVNDASTRNVRVPGLPGLSGRDLIGWESQGLVGKVEKEHGHWPFNRPLPTWSPGWRQ